MASDDFNFEDVPICSATIYEDDSDSRKFSKFFGIPKKFQALGAFLLAFLISFSAYKKYMSFSPDERELSDYNIYSGNELVITDDEYDRVISNLEEILEYDIPNEDEDDLIILDAVSRNSNLTEFQKELFYKFTGILKDNSFINKEEAYQSMLNVIVFYRDRPLTFNDNVEGVYLYPYESIGIFVDDSEYKVLVHEFIHCIFSNEYTANLPSFMKEGVTELLSNEYFSDTPYIELSNYPFEVAAVKMLCDVTSPEIVLEAYSTGNMDLIIDSINEIVDDRKLVVRAIDMLDYSIRKFNGELSNDEEVINDKNKIVNEFLPVFRGCVDYKYGKDSYEKISYYYNELLFSNIFDENPYDMYYEDLLEFGMDKRAYFSSKLINSLGKNNGTMTSINESAAEFKKEYGRIK